MSFPSTPERGRNALFVPIRAPARPATAPPGPLPPAGRGFTLIELLLALSIMVTASALVVLTFANVSNAWQRGTALAKDLGHGEFIMEQLTMALRSAYYPDVITSNASAGAYGFWLTDGGDGETARDTLSWVKLGNALVGSDPALANAPHRIQVFLVDTDEDEPAFAIKAWRPFAQPEDFDPEEIPPLALSTEVRGLDCRVATNVANEKLEWETEWEATNRLPQAVEITLYLSPVEKDGPPVQLKRCVRIPLAPLSWK
jgi:prepilin-type N-terminal cleavage/methylation domain-containing protein